MNNTAKTTVIAAPLAVYLAVAGVGLGQTTASSPSTAATRPVMAATRPVANNNVHLPRYPSVSPDGRSVVFAWRGDLWRVDVAGGTARRLTAHPQDDNFSAWSPDGSRIAFTSERVGGGNLFTMNADGSDVRQASKTDRYLVVTGWNGRDGLTLNARLEQDSFPALRSYALAPDGGEPARLFEAFGASPVVSPDGSKILFVRGGTGWLRRGYVGPDARDVWLYDRDAKTYKQLTTWHGNDGRAKWIDDATIVFASDRADGTLNLYSLKLGDDEAQAVRLTSNVGVDVEEFDVSRDGNTLVYASWDRLHRIDLSRPSEAALAAGSSSSTPIDIVAEQDAVAQTQYRPIDRSVTESALSPDGKTMAVIAFGQVYVRGVEKNAATRQVNADFGRCGDLAWSPDGSTLYFSSDAGGRDAIYAATVTLSRSDVKKALGQGTGQAAAGATATTEPAATPTRSARRRPTVRPAADEESRSVPRPDSGRGRPGSDHSKDYVTFVDAQSATQASPAPTVLPGDPIDVPTIDPAADPIAPLPASPATTPATTQAASQPTTSPTTQPATAPATLPMTTTAPATTQAVEENLAGRWPDALRFEVTPFVTAPAGASQPSPSPDGKRFAFRRGTGQLVVRDLVTGVERAIVDGWSPSLDWRWSPDGQQVAYVTEDRNNNADVFVVPADGSAAAANISKHPDNDYAPRWTADGKVLAFLSERNENESDVYSVFLDKSLEALQGVDLDAYYRDAADKARKRERPKNRPATAPATTAPTTTVASAVTTGPSTTTAPTDVRPDRTAVGVSSSSTTPTAVRSDPSVDTRPTTSSTTTTSASTTTASTRPSLDLDDAYLRVRRLTALPGSEGDLEITPAGDKVLFTANATGGRGTFVLDRDAPEPRRIANAVGVETLTFEGDKAVVVNLGQAGLLNLASGQIEAVDVSDRLAVPIAALNEQRFLEAARILGDTYYDPKLNGLDWPALTKRYLALIRPTQTAAEFEHVANKFVGELNGSHLGVSVPDAANPEAVEHGRLGVRTTRVDDGYRVTKIYAEGPAAQGAMKLAVDDVIVAVEGEPLAPADTLESALAGRVGEETLVTVRRGGNEVNLLLTPIAFAAESELAYDDWRNAMARAVADASGGALGYIHIRGMDQPSLDTFERDLFAAADGKKGLLIDVRNNGGGWTTDRLLASIMYPRHAYTVPRGYTGGETDGYPQDRLFIQRYDLPINMLCNEKSFSNAEIVSHAFKNLKRGTLVGQQTAGGVISTGAARLLDGTTVRLPGRGWYTIDGTNMEMNGAMPDVVVPQTPKQEAAGEDAQLKAAVDDLMKRLK